MLTATAGLAGTAGPAAAGLRATRIEKRFGEAVVLKGVDLEVRPGELVVVLGANGSGKSTLLRCAIRLIEPDAGEIHLGSHDLRALEGKALANARRTAAVIFQRVHLVRRRTAVENVMYGALGRVPLHRSLFHRSFPEDVRALAHASLARVGLEDRALQRADTLSGGQAQRVAIARGLCQQAQVLLADEPVAALDPYAAEVVLALLAEIARVDGLAVGCVLHQPELARKYADRIVGMADGEVVFERRPDDVSNHEVDRLYAKERADE
jgi:phosphonate transport system ATP-binding protein